MILTGIFTHPHRLFGTTRLTSGFQIYKKEVAHKKYAQPPRHKHLTNPETKKGADLAKNSAKSAPESLGR